MAGGQANGYKEETLNRSRSDWEKFRPHTHSIRSTLHDFMGAYQTAYLKVELPVRVYGAVLDRSFQYHGIHESSMDEC